MLITKDKFALLCNLTLCYLITSCSVKGDKKFNLLSSSETGIKFKNVIIDTPELNILTYLYYYNGGGVSAADFNNDGLIDLYFTGNQVEDKLYLNKGNFNFKDVTAEANISNIGNWTTGVTHTDINNDGLLDIYVCKVGNYKAIKGKNLLFVNQGLKNGVPIFKEEAELYGLDFSGFSTQAAFFDYDLDGDLDMYLMNHSVHPNRTYGKGDQRKQIDFLSGDRLYRNDNSKFIDVSQEALIFQGKSGYGLGLAISDLNNDGYPDIYIGNDFFENDYLYINQKNGTFKEIISTNPKNLGHTTHYSMGNDIGDINNDGLNDIVSLDMLPEDLITLKSSGSDYPYPSYEYYLQNGYSPQYMQNTLHLNLGNAKFSEIGNLAGISATEWSWGPLLADFDNDGYKDIYISNGIKGATNNMDFINFIADENIQKRIENGMAEKEMAFIKEIPEKKVTNYIFKNNKDLTFTNVSNEWFDSKKSFSNGCTYADLDNDGNLDIIVNNVNEEAYIFKNTTSNNNYIQFELKGTDKNRFGIGTKIDVYSLKLAIHHEHFFTRGYLSSVSQQIHIGLGQNSKVDSVIITWPDKKIQVLKNMTINQKVILDYKYSNLPLEQPKINPSYLTCANIEFNFKHEELPAYEFNRDPLIPFSNANEGPDISIADINKDGLEDVFISGAKKQASALYIQDKAGGFKSEQSELFEMDAVNEDVSQVFFDADNDGDLDLFVASGGNEFKTGKPLQPRLYLNNKGKFYKADHAFNNIEINASKIDAVDLDNDGDLDIIITSDQVPQKYAKTPHHIILQNNGNAEFINISNTFGRNIQNIGNIKDFVCVDIDNNGYKDLIIVGHWMPITVLLNDGKRLEIATTNGLSKTNGFWNVIKAEDLDNDGDIDLVVGNWGANSKLKASIEQPITLYQYDFDDNFLDENIVTHYLHNSETILNSKDELVKQLPYLNKRFLSYQEYAEASVKDILTKEKLEKSLQKNIYELHSSYFMNNGNGNFNIRKLPAVAQMSTIQDIMIEDLNSDGFKDLLIVGNSYEISTQLGRMDGSHGLILLNNKQLEFNWYNDTKLDISGASRKIKKINILDKTYFIIGINNENPIFLEKNEN